MAEITIQIQDELFTDDVKQFVDEVKSCVELYSKKNHDYGNSFDKGMDIIGASYGIGRIYDKVNRLIMLSKFDVPAVEESMDDTLRDLACYSIMMLVNRKRKLYEKQNKINFE